MWARQFLHSSLTAVRRPGRFFGPLGVTFGIKTALFDAPKLAFCGLPGGGMRPADHEQGSDRFVTMALCQIQVGEDKAENLEHAAEYVRRAAELGAKIVILPEMFNCPYSNDSFPIYAEAIPESASELDPSLHPTTATLLQLSKECGVWLVGGSIPESGPQGEIFNTCIISNPEGGIRFQESETLTPGDALTLVDTPWGRMGVGICYDMRFSGYAQACAADGAVMLVYPGAFNTTTGPLHWEILQKARAVDNQLFVAAVSPARNPKSTYQAWGHSGVVSPLGSVLAKCEHEPALVLCELDMEQVRKTRTNIPILSQQRPDVYPSAFQRGTPPVYGPPRAEDAVSDV